MPGWGDPPCCEILEECDPGVGAGGLGWLVSHRHTPRGRFGMNLKVGRWRVKLGRDEAELDRLEGSWLGRGGGSCLLREAESKV